MQCDDLIYIHIVKKIPTMKLIHSSAHISYDFLSLSYEFKFYCLSKFQLCNTVLSTIVNPLYFGSSEFIHLVTESLYPFTNHSQFHPPPIPGNCFSIVFLYEFEVFLHSVYLKIFSVKYDFMRN